MSNEALTWAFNRTLLKPGPRFVLVKLADYADQEHSCFPGTELLMEKTGFSRSAVIEHMKKLRTDGYITVERRVRADGYRTSNRYYLDVDDENDRPDLTTEHEDAAPGLGPDAGPRPNEQSPDSGLGAEGPRSRIRTTLGPESATLGPDAGPTCKEEPSVDPQKEPSALRASSFASAAEQTAAAIDDEPDSTLEVPASPPFSLDASFEAWYAGYPRKVARADARKAWPAALLAVGGRRQHAAAVLGERLEAHAAHWRDAGTAADKVPYPATWLRGRRWEDHLEQPVPPPVAQLHGRALLPAAPVVRNRHCDHGYLPGVRAPDGGIETCPHGCPPARSDRGASHG